MMSFTYEGTYSHTCCCQLPFRLSDVIVRAPFPQKIARTSFNSKKVKSFAQLMGKGVGIIVAAAGVSILPTFYVHPLYLGAIQWEAGSRLCHQITHRGGRRSTKM